MNISKFTHFTTQILKYALISVAFIRLFTIILVIILVIVINFNHISILFVFAQLFAKHLILFFQTFDLKISEINLETKNWNVPRVRDRSRSVDRN